MTAVSDEDLSNTVGQDGVSIAADLNINVGSFVYTDTDADGGSVSFNNMKFKGALAMTIDIINSASAVTAFRGLGLATAAGDFGPTNTSLSGAQQAAEGAKLTAGNNTAFYAGGDVVQIAFPDLSLRNYDSLLSTSVDSIKMGGNAASFGSFAMNKIDLRGTKVWMWAH
ncbi:MAG: hypothetical protein RR412_06950 [Burkholderiaceae bacterium]